MSLLWVVIYFSFVWPRWPRWSINHPYGSSCMVLADVQSKNHHLYRTPMKLRIGNVFTRVCPWVSLFVHRWVPIWPLPMINWTKLYRALDIRPRTHPKPSPPASDIWWPSLETCSNLFISGCPHPQEWHLVLAIGAHTVSASDQYACYLNAFLFLMLFSVTHEKNCKCNPSSTHQDNIEMSFFIAWNWYTSYFFNFQQK